MIRHVLFRHRYAAMLLRAAPMPPYMPLYADAALITPMLYLMPSIFAAFDRPWRHAYATFRRRACRHYVTLHAMPPPPGGRRHASAPAAIDEGCFRAYAALRHADYHIFCRFDVFRRVAVSPLDDAPLMPLFRIIHFRHD